MQNNRHNCAKCNSNCCGLCCTRIEDFSVTIGKNKILENVSLHIHCGELTAIIGPNGAGKSTLLKAILGETKHTGELKFMDAKGMHSGNPLIGYVPQHLSFDLSTPASVLDFSVACRTRIPTWLTVSKRMKNMVYESLVRVKAEHLMNRRLGALSGGELQRVLLALALDPIPDLLLLDEPVSGIDQNGLELFYNTVSELRKKYDLSIILVSHDLAPVSKYADRVILLNRTVVSNGTPQMVFNDEQTIKLFGLSWYKSLADKTLPDKNEGETTDA